MTRYLLLDLHSKVLLLDEKPAKLNLDGVVQDLTVRQAFRTALSSSLADDEKVTLDKKIMRYEISKKLWNADQFADLSTEEQAELKLCVGKAYNGEVLGFLIDIIERKPSSGEPPADNKNGKKHEKKTQPSASQ